MKRDPSAFPDDENGDALWSMLTEGDNLSIAREVDFSIYFSSEEDALSFGEVLLFNRQKVSLSDCEDDFNFPYEIIVHYNVIPTHSEISEYEALLQKYAEEYNGTCDGWGCYSQEE